MSTIIVSLDLLFNAITAHIISQEPFGFTKTIFVCSINSPNKLKDIRILLERNDLGKLALWFKNEYSLQHQKITVSLGPEIRKWLAQKKKQEKGYTYYESKNYQSDKRFSYSNDNKINRGYAKESA